LPITIFFYGYLARKVGRKVTTNYDGKIKLEVLLNSVLRNYGIQVMNVLKSFRILINEKLGNEQHIIERDSIIHILPLIEGG